MKQPTKLAIIDLGSNSVRMIVVEIGSSGQWRVLDEERAILRLGETLARGGSLHPALDTAKLVLSWLVTRARALDTRKIVAVATAAVRSARDGAAFAAALSRACDIQIRIISGGEEARFGFLGALNTLDLSDGNLVDIGGASSEVSQFQARSLKAAVSVPIGAITLQQAFWTSDPVQPEPLEEARRAAREALRTALPEPARGLPLAVLGGSFRSIAKVHRAAQGHEDAPLHNTHLPLAAIGDMLTALSRLPMEERLRVPGLAAHRAGIVLPALCIADAIVSWLEPSEIVVSGSGLREGVLYDRLMPARQPVLDDVFRPSVKNLLFQIGEPPDDSLVAMAGELLAALSPLLPAPLMRLGRAAAQLRGVGRRINYYGRHRHTFTLVQGARLFGLTYPEQLILAAAAAYEGPRRTRELLAPYRADLNSQEIAQAQRLGLAVAFAEAICRTMPDACGPVSATLSPSVIELSLHALSAPLQLPYGELDRLSLQFPKVYGRKLVARYGH